VELGINYKGKDHDNGNGKLTGFTEFTGLNLNDKTKNFEYYRILPLLPLQKATFAI